MSDKTVLITGSSKGLGKSLALVFSENKYNIILHGRNEQGLEKVEEGVLKNNVDCNVIRGDITSDKTIESLYEASVRRNLDILINNAGIYANESFRDMDIEQFRRMIDINLIAPVILIKRIYPIFLRKKSGLIININSIAGKNATAGESAYCASKHGLRGFTRSFQYEANKDGVRVMDVYPGTMNTSIVEGRRDPEKCIQIDEAADLIYRMCKDYNSLRINEIDLSRRRY